MNISKYPSGTNAASSPGRCRLRRTLYFAATALFCLLTLAAARAQTDIYVSNDGGGSVGEYTTSASGTTITGSAPSLITGLNSPWGVAVSGSDVFVLNINNGSVGLYSTSGSALNASLITGLPASSVYGIAVSGSQIFLTNATANSGTNFYVGEYTDTGGTVSPALFAPHFGPSYIAVSGTNVFVTTFGNGGSISEYTTTGGTVNASLVTGAGNLAGIAVSGSNIYAVNYSANTIQEYTLSGTVISSSNTALVTGLSFPQGIAVVSAAPAVPGPGVPWLLALGGGLVLCICLRSRRKA